jgi:8-oxo-dGTP pyrophosphatase MutT (NUDIX family)
VAERTPKRSGSVCIATPTQVIDTAAELPPYLWSEIVTVIDKIAWIRIEDGAILSTRSAGKDAYYIPGGKREAGESDIETLVREIHEELSVTIVADTAEHAGTFHAQAHGHPDGTVVRMSCYTAEYQGELRPDSEIEEIVWLTYADRDRVSPVDRIIFDDLHRAAKLRGQPQRSRRSGG